MTTDTKHVDKLDQLEARLAQQKAQLADLATMGTVITSIHEIDAVLSVVMDMALRLVDGEVGLILLEEDGKLKSKIGWGVSEEFVRNLVYEDGVDLAAYCFANQQTVMLADLDITTDQGMALNSVIASPIKKSDKCFGVMVIINKSSGGGHTAEDREILERLLNFVAVAVDNSHLMRERLQQQKLKQEMAIAKQVQETLLPRDLEDIPGVDIGAMYFPARDVGGDFYDVVRLDDTRFILVLGDVSNKGVPAAIVMSALSGVMKSTLLTKPDISVSSLAETLNNILSEQIIKDREMFVTLFIAKFDLEQKQIGYCNAGHLPGLFWENETREIHGLPTGGPIVGQFAGIPYQEGTHPLASGDRLFLFTDGLTEAMDSDDNLFGRERVEQVFSVESHLPPRQFCLKVKEWVDRFAEGASEESQDDFTILQVEVL